MDALSGLSDYGERARCAVPEILKLLDEPGPVSGVGMKQAVNAALWQIAPEKIGRPIVVEDSTPMIANGVTTQALTLLFLGGRRTLIPAGRTVPAVAECWDGEPKADLMLYRGPEGSEDIGHFLGHFEVLGLPKSGRVNVSALCVVAEGRIVLCARDKNREEFLEIRRVGQEPAG
jgi:hypothetical protein